MSINFIVGYFYGVKVDTQIGYDIWEVIEFLDEEMSEGKDTYFSIKYLDDVQTNNCLIANHTHEYVIDGIGQDMLREMLMNISSDGIDQLFKDFCEEYHLFMIDEPKWYFYCNYS